MVKSTGIVRRIDDLGRVVIAKELRRTLGIKEGDPLETFTDGDSIILRKYNPGCSMFGSLDNLKTIDGMNFCPECIKRITAAGK